MSYYYYDYELYYFETLSQHSQNMINMQDSFSIENDMIEKSALYMQNPLSCV